MTDMTFLILKPDCVARGLVGRIISRIEDAGIIIVNMMTRRKNKEWCKLHYAHVPEEAYTILEGVMCGRTMIGMIVYGPDVIQKIRTLIGNTDPLKAAPGTIRGDFGCQLPYNLIHASDSAEAVEREAAWFANPLTNAEEDRG